MTDESQGEREFGHQLVGDSSSERTAPPNVDCSNSSGSIPFSLVFPRQITIICAGQHYIRQLGVWRQNSVAVPTGYCLVTWMLFALIVSVKPAVWLVNDPLSEPAVKAV